ncbi:phosphoribosyltransferase, partial [Clostridioides difficile]
VSRLLGKHIPVNPYTSLLSGAALAVLLYEHLTEETEETKVQITEWKREKVEGLIDPKQARQVYNMLLQESLSLPETIRFVGFAETATALGHSMYEMFADHASYIHTTREYVPVM